MREGGMEREGGKEEGRERGKNREREEKGEEEGMKRMKGSLAHLFLWYMKLTTGGNKVCNIHSFTSPRELL